MNNCAFIIFGATGDLSRRKLIPAIYKLLHDNKISNFIILGAAIDAINAEQMLDAALPHVKNVNKTLLDKMKKACFYQQLDFEKEDDFFRLNELLSSLEKKHNLSGNRMAYLATSSYYFCTITTALGKSKIIEKKEGPSIWHRITYEKPFGIDEQSAKSINQCIMQWFNEKQIFRIDHYLTKELVSNIVLVRFTNIIFEPLWNNKYIDHVEIIMEETLGVEERGMYYDKYGVLKDIVQNHVMQLIALIAMELPRNLTAQGIASEKAKVLNHIRYSDGLLGQYEGYSQEKYVEKNSQTPTFACLRMLIETPRWKGVPFYIKAGKKLRKKDTSIHIFFKNVDCTIKESCIYESNYLSIQIEPGANFSLHLNAKQPGSIYEVTPISLQFNHSYTFGSTTPEAYEILLEQIMLGDQSIAVRFDEIEYAWKIIDSIPTSKLKLDKYPQLTDGPESFAIFNTKYHLRWRS